MLSLYAGVGAALLVLSCCVGVVQELCWCCAVAVLVLCSSCAGVGVSMFDVPRGDWEKNIA